MAASWYSARQNAAPLSVVTPVTMMGRAVSDDNAEQLDQL
jgi:hypothetical protein